MEYICLDLEGVLVPEIWSEVANWSGEDKFNLTTQDLKDYSELMDIRLNLVNSLGISMEDIMSVVDKMEPFPTSRSFLDWARDNFQVVIVSDSFYELAWPLIRKLGNPSMICHTLDIQNGLLKGYNLRQLHNKKRVVEHLKALKYKVFSSFSPKLLNNFRGEKAHGVTISQIRNKWRFLYTSERFTSPK